MADAMPEHVGYGTTWLVYGICSILSWRDTIERLCHRSDDVTDSVEAGSILRGWSGADGSWVARCLNHNCPGASDISVTPS